MTKVYYDQSVEKDALQGKNCNYRLRFTGHAHAQNLKDNGYDVIVGIRPGHSLIKLKKMASMFIQLQKLLNKQMSSWCYCQMKSRKCL